MKNHLPELGKSLLILVLICTLLLLTLAAMPAELLRSTPWLSSLLQPIAPLVGLPQAELAYVEDALPVTDAAQPLAVSIHSSTGRHTAQWDFEALDDAYETLGGMLGEALDTAGDFTAVRPKRLQQALSKPSVSFDYNFPLPARLLAFWLNAVPPEDAPAGSVYVLAVEDNQVNLYLRGDGCYRAATQVSPTALLALLEQFKADGSRFAFETTSHLADLALIPGADPVIAAGASSNPIDNRYIEALATELGFNPYDDTSYTDSRGVTYFSEANCSLQIGADGAILLTSTSAERFQASGDTMEILVEEARAMLETAVGDVLGDARLYLSGVTTDGATTVCTFSYILNGIPVRCGDAPAAAVTFTGRAVTELRLLAAGFSLSAETLKIIPPTQAMAILPAGGALKPEYARARAGSLTAGWQSAQ